MHGGVVMGLLEALGLTLKGHIVSMYNHILWT